MISKDKIEQILRQHLSVQSIQVIDETERHAGHAESQQRGGSHFKVIVVAKDFSGKKHLERHKMIYGILKTHMAEDIHALVLKCYSPEEI